MDEKGPQTLVTIGNLGDGERAQNLRDEVRNFLLKNFFEESDLEFILGTVDPDGGRIIVIIEADPPPTVLQEGLEKLVENSIGGGWPTAVKIRPRSKAVQKDDAGIDAADVA